LRVDAIAAAFRVVEHSVPLATFTCHSLEKTAVALRGDFVEQELDGWPHRSPDAKFGRGAAPERDRPLLPPKPDITDCDWHVRFVPYACNTQRMDGGFDEHYAARRFGASRQQSSSLFSSLLSCFKFSPVERFFYKFDGIDCCPKLNAKLVNRLFHRWWQVP